MLSSSASRYPLLLQRDRIVLLFALIGVSVLAWAYIIFLWSKMPGMDIGATVAMQQWTPMDFVFMLVMWAIMMVGMMLPSAVPMTLLYAGLARKAERQGTPMAPTAAFVSGYLTLWGLFSVGATVAQWGLHEAALLSSMMMAKNQELGAALLIVAGVYQLTPWKTVCLDHCRSPAHFIADHWRAGTSGAFRLGLHHGAFCVGYCWALMGLLFVGGVMNLLWIAAITIFVFLEKVVPAEVIGVQLRGMAGIGMILSGLVMSASWLAGGE